MRADGHKCSACLFNVRLKYFVFMKLSLADRIHRDIDILNLFSTSGREGKGGEIEGGLPQSSLSLLLQKSGFVDPGISCRKANACLTY